MPPKTVQTKGSADVMAAALGGDSKDKKDEKKGAKGGKAGGGGGSKTKKTVIKAPIGQVRKTRKGNFRAKLFEALGNYKNILIINVDNVSSNQLQLVRLALRKSDSQILMGKNTVVRKVLRDNSDPKLGSNLFPKLKVLLDQGLVKYNVGFVFTNAKDLSEIRDLITLNKVPAPATAGKLAPADVTVPAGVTTLDPQQTNFFQALNIGTKITRGAIEIINAVNIIKKDEKISASAVALLAKLNIKPFFYGITLVKVYEDGVVYNQDVLDIDKKHLYTAFMAGIKQLTQISLAVGHLTKSTIPYVLRKGHNYLVYLAMAIDYSFPFVDQFKPKPAGAADAEKPAEGEAKKDDKKKSGSGSGSGSGSKSGSGSD